jgi:hypothetical protein
MKKAESRKRKAESGKRPATFCICFWLLAWGLQLYSPLTIDHSPKILGLTIIRVKIVYS